MPLEKYRAKRHFEKTTEPAGIKKKKAKPGSRTGKAELLYVMQKHAASRLHYDLRLELDGVFLSWAVPKGPSLDPHDRHLAARVEDHPLEYGSFEGTIPKGEYGAGTVEIWDRGTWEPEGDAKEGLAKGDLKFTLRGEKLKGSWVLVRMKPRAGQEDKENWLLIKHRDDEAVDKDGRSILDEQPRSVASGRTLDEIAAGAGSSVWHSDQPAGKQTETRPAEEFRLDPSSLKGAVRSKELPGFVRPQLTTLADAAPTDGHWLHEIKFDGYRAIARIEGGSAKIYSRSDKDWTSRFGLIAEELAKLPVERALLDGEVVVQMPDGTTSFQQLQNVVGAPGARKADGRDPSGRLLYYVFDLLHLNDFDLLASPIEERKELLSRLLARANTSGRILFSTHLPGEGGPLFERACEMGLEGLISKRAGSRYTPGARGTNWLKTKCRHQQEFVVGGYTDPAGSRTGFGALLVGVRNKKGLRYVGKVGTGFDDNLLRHLGERLRKSEVGTSPFVENSPRARENLHWIRPEMVAEVAFTEWTRDGGIRHPSFKGLREDKPAAEVVAEVPAEMPAGKSAAKLAATSVKEPADPPNGSAGSPAHDDGRDTASAKGVSDKVVNGVALTHPDRIFWPHDRITKLDLVAYYDSVAEQMLPYVLGRPVAMVRCPGGIGDLPAPVRQGRSRVGECFFHKHPGEDFPGPFQKVMITESGGTAPYLTISEPASLTALAQMGVLEIHIWGSTWPDIEHPDLLIFDLDPDPTVDWPTLAAAARLMKDILDSLSLVSFVKTTGGKGLHVVAPVTPSGDWSSVRPFCKGVADAVVREAPDKFTSNMLKAKREGKIFIDYVRNNRGATSIAPYSTRAKERATVAVPLRWSDLSARIRPDTYTVKTLKNRLGRLEGDPWVDYSKVQRSQSLTAKAMEAVSTLNRERT